MTSRRRIHGRQRVGMAAGLLVLASLTACIFDRSDYQGGGRLDKGATAGQVPKDAAGPVPPDTKDMTDAADPLPLTDAAGGG